MINIDFTNIDNAKLIGRLLPFWARGKKTSLLLQAILSPIIPAHNAFKSWALKIFIECHITAQRASLEWYLKYCLKSHFYNEEDEFLIAHGSELLCCFSNDIWTNELNWNNVILWGSSQIDSGEQTIVYAPRIVDTINYDHEDYKRDIKYIMSKFMINFDKVNIIIADT